MKIVNKIQGSTTTYDKIDTGDVFKFDNLICIAINDNIILMHNPILDEWQIEDAPTEDDEIILFDCELVIKGEK
jgi:hypothetical protein